MAKRKDLRDFYLAGQNITLGQAEYYEKTLKNKPSLYKLRAKLLGHYYNKAFILEDKTALEHILTHGMWFIKNKPGCSFSRYSILMPFYTCNYDINQYKQIKKIYLNKIKFSNNDKNLYLNLTVVAADYDPNFTEELFLKVSKRCKVKNIPFNDILSFYSYEAGVLGLNFSQHLSRHAAKFAKMWLNLKLPTIKEEYTYKNLEECASIFFYSKEFQLTIKCCELILKQNQFYSFDRKEFEYQKAYSLQGKAWLHLNQPNKAKEILNLLEPNKDNQDNPAFHLIQEFIDLNHYDIAIEYLTKWKTLYDLEAKKIDSWIEKLKNNQKIYIYHEFMLPIRKAYQLYNNDKKLFTSYYEYIKELPYRPDYMCSFALLALKINDTATIIKNLQKAYEEDSEAVISTMELESYKALKAYFPNNITIDC